MRSCEEEKVVMHRWRRLPMGVAETSLLVYVLAVPLAAMTRSPLACTVAVLPGMLSALAFFIARIGFPTVHGHLKLIRDGVLLRRARTSLCLTRAELSAVTWRPDRLECDLHTGERISFECSAATAQEIMVHLGRPTCL